VPHEVTRVTPTGLVDATGTERRADVLILSTGFQPTRSWRGIEVKGRDGAYPRRVAGTAQRVPGHHRGGLPNFFILYGRTPTAGCPSSPSLNGKAEVAANAVRRLERGTVLRRTVLRRTVRSIDTRPASAAPVGGLDRPPARHGRHGDGLRLPQLLPRRGRRERSPQWPGTHLGYAVATRLLARPACRAALTQLRRATWPHLDGGAQCLFPPHGTAAGRQRSPRRGCERA